MKKLASSALAVLLLASAAARTEAQMIFRTYYGCGVWSCHWVEWTSFPVAPEYGPNVFISTDAWYFAPDGLGGAVPEYWRFVPIYETGLTGYADYAISDPEPPSAWAHDVKYGPVDMEWPAGEVWSETVWLEPIATPEPASVLLLLGGLAGVGAAARRSRRRTPQR